ncbi:MAG: flagellar hook capping FlgD N-terminal domain-containing protein [Syntrophomonadaceae bacterium]|nr:flagellar hook capping FlgD N-terminal domain-containing protein [Syntrophomonadaceae bacterium]
MAIETRYETVPWLRSVDNSSNISAANKGILDKDDFLKLLITELKYQDPMEPMKDKEFIAQMASFTSLEQMKNLNTGFEKLSGLVTDNLLPAIQLNQASSMIGKEVKYLNPETNEEQEEGEDEEQEKLLSGIVSSVIMKDGQAYCVINGKNIALSSIVEINTSKSTDDKIMNEILQEMKKLVDAMAGGAENDG